MQRLLFALCLLSALCASAQERVIFTSISSGPDSSMKWSISQNKAGVLYVIQQHRWNSWKDLDTVMSVPDADSALYSFDVKKYFITGENKFRVRAVADKMLTFSKIIKVSSSRSGAREIRRKFSRKKDPIDLGREEYYELYDKDGNVLMRGLSRTIPVSGLQPGHYYLNYGELSTEIDIH
jgi:hypothetical protein